MRFILLIFFLFTFNAAADSTARPSSNNKIGHSKQDTASKQESFFYKLFNNELDDNGSSSSTNNDKILSQIERLADFKKRGIISEVEFKSKKTLLLKKIQ